MLGIFLDYIAIILPLLILQLILLVTALFHLLKNDRIEQTNKIIWALIILFINIIGPIAYLIFGRREE